MDIDDLGELLRLLRSSDVEELELEHLGTRVLIRRDPAGTATPHRVLHETIDETPVPFVVTAPLVGVFRRSVGGPAEPPVEEGSTIVAGQVVGSVEAMRMLNRVQSEHPGIVDQLLVQDGQPVEYGQPLLVLRAPNASNPPSTQGRGS